MPFPVIPAPLYPWMAEGSPFQKEQPAHYDLELSPGHRRRRCLSATTEEGTCDFAPGAARPGRFISMAMQSAADRR